MGLKFCIVIPIRSVKADFLSVGSFKWNPRFPCLSSEPSASWVAIFSLDKDKALAVLAEVQAAVANWREIAVSPEVGMRREDLEDFATAFEHEQMEMAAALLKH
jgi:hypothetical protein